MRSFLEKAGFKLSSSCNCGGDPRETWVRAKPLVYVDIRPERESFKIRNASPQISGHAGAIATVLGDYLRKRGLDI